MGDKGKKAGRALCEECKGYLHVPVLELVGRREIKNVQMIDCRVSSNRRSHRKPAAPLWGHEYKSPSRLGLEALKIQSLKASSFESEPQKKEESFDVPSNWRHREDHLYIGGCRPTVRHRTESGQSTHRHHPCPPPLATSSK